MPSTTVIRNCSWLVAWADSQHVYQRDVDVAFSGAQIIHVGPDYSGHADVVMSGVDRLVMPGLVNIHTHSATEPLNKGFREEIRSRNFWDIPLYEFLYMIDVSPEAAVAASQVAVGELLLSGVTTFVHLGQLQLGVDSLALYEGFVRSGIRAYLAPMFREARWKTSNGHAVEYVWNKEAGRADFERAKDVVDFATSHPSNRLFGMVAPGQIDTVTDEMIVEAYAFAKERHLPFQIHIAQAPNEFHEMIRRTGRTPIGHLRALGALGERTVLGHCIFLDHHPWLRWSSRDDLDSIAEAGASVAHCPVEYLRRGVALRTLGAYLERGVNVGIGTDTTPHNMLDEMRAAIYAARIISESVSDISTADVFHAATIGGANALLREDIGRLAVGCRADIVLADIKHPSMMPCRDPLRSLIYTAGERPICDVFVDGEQVMRDGRLVNVDLPAALDVVEKAQQAGSRDIAKRDWAGRSLNELAPLALPVRATDRVGDPTGHS